MDDKLKDKNNFHVETWFERDRAHVELLLNNDVEIEGDMPDLPEWWDEDVHEAIEDGFLDPKDYLGSAHEYYVQMFLQPWIKWSK